MEMKGLHIETKLVDQKWIVVDEDHPEGMPKKGWIFEKLNEGWTVAELAKALEVQYQSIYMVAKAWKTASGNTLPGGTGTGGGRKIMIEVDGVQVPRREYMREQFLAGKSRGQLAKELGVQYQIVFAATRELKTAEPAKASDVPVPDAAPTGESPFPEVN